MLHEQTAVIQKSNCSKYWIHESGRKVSNMQVHSTRKLWKEGWMYVHRSVSPALYERVWHNAHIPNLKEREYRKKCMSKEKRIEIEREKRERVTVRNVAIDWTLRPRWLLRKDGNFFYAVVRTYHKYKLNTSFLQTTGHLLIICLSTSSSYREVFTRNFMLCRTVENTSALLVTRKRER